MAVLFGRWTGRTRTMQHPALNFLTGSLGQGITYAVGQALALKRTGSPARVYCLISDAECQEGSVWEATALASRLQLDNLTIIVDNNGMGAMGALDPFLILRQFRWVQSQCIWYKRTPY